jgi:hypothetical protein
MAEYFVIRNSDGETYVDRISADDLLRQLLDEDYYGGKPVLKDLKEPSTNYWGGSILIIKGEIVSPRPVKIVFEID